MIQIEIEIDPPEPLGLYFGCTYREHEVEVYGIESRVPRYDMSNRITDKCATSLELLQEGADLEWELNDVPTPFVPENTNESPCRLPEKDDDGSAIACPWCRHSFLASDALDSDQKSPGMVSKRAGKTTGRSMCETR